MYNMLNLVFFIKFMLDIIMNLKINNDMTLHKR